MGDTIAQKAYNKLFMAAVEGGLYDISEFLDIVTMTNTTNAAGTPFGCLVSNVAGYDSQVKLPSVAGDVAFPLMSGISMFTQLIENAGMFITSASSYPINTPIATLRKGRIWVKPEESVAVGDDVYVRITAAASPNDQIGKFRKSADGGNAILIPAPYAKWFKGRDANGYAVLEVNF